MKMTKKIASLVLPLALFFILALDARAVTVSPVIIEHEVAPGMRVQGKIMVINDSAGKQTYYTSIQSFVPEGEEGGQKYLEEAAPSGLPAWFRLSESSITLEPNESKEIQYTLDVPANAEPGGHYATLFYSTTPELEKNRTNVGIAAKTGIIFLVKVAGDVKEDATIESFTVNRRLISSLPAMMSLRIRNNGTVHFRPEGTLTIRNMWGGIVAKVPANPKNSAVLPTSIRRLDTWWIKDVEALDCFKEGHKIECNGFWFGLQNEWKNFALGRYVATVDVKYGSKNVPLEPRTVSFWVIPWRMGLILLGLLVILFVAIKIYNRALINAALGKKEAKK